MAAIIEENKDGERVFTPLAEEAIGRAARKATRNRYWIRDRLDIIQEGRAVALEYREKLESITEPGKASYYLYNACYHRFLDMLGFSNNAEKTRLPILWDGLDLTLETAEQERQDGETRAARIELQKKRLWELYEARRAPRTSEKTRRAIQLTLENLTPCEIERATGINRHTATAAIAAFAQSARKLAEERGWTSGGAGSAKSESKPLSSRQFAL